MRPSFHPRLVNGPFQDPGLLVSWTFRKRAILLDLGDPGSLAPGDILKVSHVFVSHTHMDHFAGFDHLLRLMLGRSKEIGIYGPAGFLDNVEAKLRGYTWNLVENYLEALVLKVTEVHPDRCISRSFDCRTRFRPGRKKVGVLKDDILLRDSEVSVSTAILDHGTPSLAFALQEPFHINIRKTALQTLGLATGPWINHFKQMLYAKADPRTPIHVSLTPAGAGAQTFELAFLAERIAAISAGQKIVYVADAVYNPSNVAKITALARQADHLFIEAAFLDRDRDIARAKYHLTAHQAGCIARQAQAKKMTVFHYSPRYLDQGHLLAEEARLAFEGRV